MTSRQSSETTMRANSTKYALLGLEEAVGEGEEDDGVNHEAGLGGNAVILGLDFENGPGQVVIDELEGAGMCDHNK